MVGNDGHNRVKVIKLLTRTDVTLHTATVTYQCSHARKDSEQRTREQDCEQRTGEQKNSETRGHEWYYSDMRRTR
jgi:hypothetical protein